MGKNFDSAIGPPSMDVDGRISFESEGYLYVLSEEGELIHKIEVDGLFGCSYPLSLTNDIFLCEVNRCKLISFRLTNEKNSFGISIKGFLFGCFSNSRFGGSYYLYYERNSSQILY